MAKVIDADTEEVEDLDESSAETLSIEAIRTRRPFSSIQMDPLYPEGYRYVKHHVVTTDYEKDASARVLYYDNGQSHFRLGVATGQFQVPDHLEVVRPLLDLGFVPQKILHGRGGASIFAVMGHPDIMIPDPVSWDKGLYTDHLGNRAGMLMFSLAVHADARVGKSYRLIAGFFRLICTNGLVSKLLGLGYLTMNHRTFNTARIADFARHIIEPGAEGMQLSLPAIPTRALDWPMQVLTQALDGDEQIQRLPPIVRQPVRTLTERMPNWAIESLGSQLQLMREGSDTITALDVINALTNVHNSRESETNRIYFFLDRWVGALIDLILMGAFKADIPVTGGPTF